MSTQRWEGHSAPTTEDRSKRALRGWRILSGTACARNCEQLKVARFAMQCSSPAKASTATNTEATNSLQSDFCTSRYVQVVRPKISRGAFPFWAADRTNFVQIANRRSSLPLIPHPPVLARLHPALPQFPAAKGSRTERYDGKRDLHFQHAA